MLVREVMTSPACSIRPEASVRAAIRLLVDHHVTSAPVVDGQGHVVGIVSEHDLLSHSLEPDPRAHLRPLVEPEVGAPGTVADVMTPEPRTVHENDDVADVAAIFSTHSWKSLPAVRDGLLVGVVSRSDIVRVLSRDDSAIITDIRRGLADAGQPPWQVESIGGRVRIRGVNGDRERGIAAAVARCVSGVQHVQVEGDVPAPVEGPGP